MKKNYFINIFIIFVLLISSVIGVGCNKSIVEKEEAVVEETVDAAVEEVVEEEIEVEEIEVEEEVVVEIEVEEVVEEQLISIEDQLIEIREWLRIDVWNFGFAEVMEYLVEGGNVDIDFMLRELNKTINKKDSYGVFINNLSDKKYDELKYLWGKVSDELDKAQIELNDYEMVPGVGYLTTEEIANGVVRPEITISFELLSQYEDAFQKEFENLFQ